MCGGGGRLEKKIKKKQMSVTKKVLGLDNKFKGRN